MITDKELDQIVHEVAAIVLATPVPYANAAENAHARLLEQRLQAYIRQLKASKQPYIHTEEKSDEYRDYLG
jgi:hypothetical protein